MDRSELFKPSTIWKKDNDTDLADFSGSRFPRKMLLSLTSNCNLKCRHCARGHGFMGTGAMVSKETLDNIIKDFFPSISAIRLGGSDTGEQTTYPYFEFFLEAVKRYRIDLQLTTNATAITEKNAGLIISTVALIDISMEGMGKNYEKIRGFDWDHFVKNIELLVSAKDNLKTKKPLIGFNVTALREHKEDYFKLLRFAREKKIDQIVFRNLEPYSLRDYKSVFAHYENEHNAFYEQIKKEASDIGITVSCPAPILGRVLIRKACSLPFEVFGIQADGRIITCCGNPADLGFYTSGYKNIMERWMSRNFIMLRRTVNSSYPLPACRNCEVVVANHPSVSRCALLAYLFRIFRKGIFIFS